MIELIHGLFNFTLCNGLQVPVFREILSNVAIGIFVKSAFPGGIRMGEINTGIKVAGHAFVVGKFPAIVIGNSVHPVDVRGKPVYDSVPDSLGRLADDGPDDGAQRLALDQRHQSALMALADHGVTLPITEALLGIKNGRTLINRDLVGNRATSAIDAIALAPDLLTTQIPVQVAT